MIGSNLSRWTMSYFAIALAWLLAAQCLMAVGFGYPATDLASPDTLVLVHIVGIGWLSMAMCGALLQFVPVLVVRPLFAEDWALPAFSLLTAGLVGLLAGFLMLGGRLSPWLAVFPVSALLLMAGFGLTAANLGLTIWRARPVSNSARFVGLGLISVIAVATFGGVFAATLAGFGGSTFGTMTASGVPLHAIAALGGWLTLISVGVSYRLLSMFMLSPDVDAVNSRMTLFAGAATLAIVLIGGVVAVLTTVTLDVVLMLAGIAGLVTLALYGRDVIGLYRRRKRLKLELNTRMTAYALASLGAAGILAVALVTTGSFSAHVGAFVFLICFGWLSGLILAQLYKIVAFLTWLETYGSVMGRMPIPRVQDLVAESRAALWFEIYFVSVWIATALLLGEAQFAFRIAMAVMTLATAGIVFELIRIRKLAEVTGSRRLPDGVAAPRLMLPRAPSGTADRRA